MDSEPAPPAASKPPPRISRLPLSTTKSSHIPIPKQNGAPEPSKTPAAAPVLGTRRSIATLPRAGPSTDKAPLRNSKPSAAKGSGLSGSKQAVDASTGSRASAIRPLSRANQQRQPQTAGTSVSTVDKDENQDQLSSLNSFRTGSRQGWPDASPTEPEPAELPSAGHERKKSRPSLSDRTIESLSGLPTTPKERRRSSFFSPGNKMAPPPRPSSSLSRNDSNGNSRPGTSDGNFGQPIGFTPSVAKWAPASAKPASKTSLGGFGFTPGRSTSTLHNGKRHDSSVSVSASPRSPSPVKRPPPSAISNGAKGLQLPSKSKTVGLKPSESIAAYQDSSEPTVKARTVGQPRRAGTKLENSPLAKTAGSSPSPTNQSSAALREQIAAARAAARKAKTETGLSHQTPSTNGDLHSVIDLHQDPFNQVPRDEKHILRNRINTARMDGRLNIAAMGLKAIPDEVLQMYSSAATEQSNISWAEVVDLSRLNAADNEIEELGEDVFPDVSAQDLTSDDQTEGNQFGGLEILDFHGNRLHSLPLGLRRLERLTTLNLSHNKLENNALDVISQIESLRDLKLGHNNLSGSIPSTMCGLRHLESLDLQSNRLLGLPEALRELVKLKVLNISGNQLTALPIDAIELLPLTELDASSNALIGSLFPPTGSSSHHTLRSLKVANNSIAALTFSEFLQLPQLRTLDVTNNHLTGLPSVAGWNELVTLTAGDNKITELPHGFTELWNLRNVNFTSNDLRLLDPKIAKMKSLESLMLAANPLREKKFLTMSAADIKRDLQARLEPSPGEDGDEQEDFQDARDSFSPSFSSSKSSWTMQANGKLDLGGKGYADEINDALGSFLQAHDVKQLHLCSNKLTSMPPALWLGQDLRVLDLSGNSLGADYLSDELSLPALTDLNISRCNVVTIEPLTTHLQAPNLQTLNISINRLNGAVPILHQYYPTLRTLLASDNKFDAVTAESLRGLHAVNLASNNIEQLPAEIGLLWDEGLRSFEVGSNAFRVPNHRLLEKGTEAVMRYLRDRIPEARKAVVGNGPATHTAADE